MPQRRFILVVVALAGALSACSSGWPDQPLIVASAFTSHQVCSETFISGLDPQQIYAERVKPTGALRYLDPLIQFGVDRDKREVTTTVAGLYKSQAVYREHLGCLVVHGAAPADSVDAAGSEAANSPPAARVPEIAGAAVVEPREPRLKAAIERAFTERDQAPYIRTKAIVVIKDGRIVGERYATGIGIDTPLLGFSMTKSVTNALIGILVRQGKLAIDQPAPIAGWQDSQDRRRAITVDQLLRQTSGLALEQDNSGFDVNSRMLYIERDMAGYASTAAATATPGARWAYTDGNYMLISGVIRDAVGGKASDVGAFAQRELFAPIGMKTVTLEFDATGTPLGASYLFASARDWARFGLLYLNDGVAGDERILPEGWVKYSTTPTLDTGYGAGFWTNRPASAAAPWGLPWGMPNVPSDAFFAMGFMGQHVVIVPSERLVVVRIGISHHRDGLIVGVDRLVADAIAALHREN